MVTRGIISKYKVGIYNTHYYLFTYKSVSL